MDAALTAAAYARKVLLVLRPRKVDAMPAWAEKISQSKVFFFFLTQAKMTTNPNIQLPKR
jgi:thioredoxin reductase